MPAILIPCPHCAKPSQIDSVKLPDKPVFFPCPHCNGRVVVDKRKLMSSTEATAATHTASPATESGAPAAPSPPASSTQAGAPPSAVTPQTDITPPAVEFTAPDRRFANVPPDAILPSGIIVGEEESVIGEIRESLAVMGSEVEHVASPDAARQMIVNEQPDLCIYVSGKIEAAPHAAMAPLTGLHPSFRRRLYLMLIADNLKTFDPNAAFIHEVNMVLDRQDLPRIGAALYGGLDYHNRLYKAYLEATDKKGSI